MSDHVRNDSYRQMPFAGLGRSGLKVPRISLGLWHNFGAAADPATCRRIVLRAFELGITCFDLANNYGPPAGHAEEQFGRILTELPRDELVIATKAGYEMWPGPYGDWGSAKHLRASLDQSLGRLGIDYIDLFYHHRPDPGTPLDETLAALGQSRRAGKAIYTGISNYGSAQTEAVIAIAAQTGARLPIVNQCRHNLLQPGFDQPLRTVAADAGIGLVAYSPLAQGLLTDRYRHGIVAGSRASRSEPAPGDLTSEAVGHHGPTVARFAEAAARLGIDLQELALAWVLDDGVTGAIVGASKVEQVEQAVRAAALKIDWHEVADRVPPPQSPSGQN